MARLAGAHGRQGGTRNIECSLHVDCECRANLISGDLFDRPNESAARVIDQHIDLTKTLQCGIDCFLRLLFISDVELQSQQSVLLSKRILNRLWIACCCDWN